MSNQRFEKEEEKIPRQWHYCISHPKGQLLESESDYEEAEAHTEKTGEVWFDCPTKVAAAVEEKTEADAAKKKK